MKDERGTKGAEVKSGYLYMISSQTVHLCSAKHTKHIDPSIKEVIVYINNILVIYFQFLKNEQKIQQCLHMHLSQSSNFNIKNKTTTQLIPMSLSLLNGKLLLLPVLLSGPAQRVVKSDSRQIYPGALRTALTQDR